MLKPVILALALITATSPALASSQKLPFVGKRSFNFYGGSGTDLSITINKNGTATIKSYGSLAAGGQAYTTYRGKYRTYLPDGDGGYYQIKGNTMRWLDANKQLKYDCEGFAVINPDSGACITQFY